MLVNWYAYTIDGRHVVIDATTKKVILVSVKDAEPDIAKLAARAPKLEQFARFVADFFDGDTAGHAKYLRAQAIEALK